MRLIQTFLLIAVASGLSVLAAQTFSNTSNVDLPAGQPSTTNGPGGPSPSQIAVSGTSGNIISLTVTLTGISHTYPDDLDFLLVGPTGASCILMSDCGGGNDLTGVTLTFDDAASGSLPDATQITAGTYRPTDFVTGDAWTNAPTGPYGTMLSAFSGSGANGTWNLYSEDDVGGDYGLMSGGWSITVTLPGDPEIDVQRPSGTSKTSTGIDVIGSLPVSTPTNVTWTIENQGASNALTVSAISAASSGVGNVSVTASPALNPTGPIAASGGTATFIVAVTPQAAGPFEFTITITNTDADEGTYTIIVQGVSGVSSPFNDDMEGGANGWSTAGTSASLWQLGTPTTVGPTTAYSGSNCWGTNLTGDYGVTNAQAYLLSPAIDLTGTSQPLVSFYHYLDSESAWDGGALQVSVNGGTFTTLLVGDSGFLQNGPNDTDVDGCADNENGWSGTPTGSAWAQVVMDITAMTTVTITTSDTIQFRFWFGADGSFSAYPGWYIDDFFVGDPPPAEIDVSYSSNPVPHRGSVDVGNVSTAGENRTFAIDNTGTLDLNLTGTSPDYVVVTGGMNIASVAVGTQPSTPVAGSGTSSFILSITPSAAGNFDLTVQIDNDDASPMQLANGTDGVLTMSSSNFASATANFVAADVGTQIVISGSGSGNDGTYTITSVNSATDVTLGTAPAAAEGTLAWSHESSESSYTFTVTGTGFVANGPAVADPATVSNFTGTTNGPFNYAVDPGTTLADGDIELTDGEGDTITVNSITPPGTAPTGIAGPTIPTPGQPLTLSWTGTAAASNAPGAYTWVVNFVDSVNGTAATINVTITINNVAPTHTAASGVSGDGLGAGTQYVAIVAIGAGAALDIADCDDANLGNNITVTGQSLTASPGGSSVTFAFTTTGTNPDVLRATPSAAPATADIGDYDYTVTISDGTNPVTVFVRITVPANAAAVANPATVSNFTGSTNGPFNYAVDPGTTLANADIDLTDAEGDTITVSAITPPGTAPTGITGPTIPTPGQPLTLSWTGTANATNTPGAYTWVVSFADAVNGSTVNVNVVITINNVAPTHVAATGVSGDGLATGTQYVAATAVGSAAALDIATATDANTPDSVTVSGQSLTASPGGSSVTFTFGATGSNPATLQATPSAAPAVADIGNFDYSVTITDGANPVVVFVRITVNGAAPTITSAAAQGTAVETVLYTHTFTATGNPTPTFAVTTGTLPTWLNLVGAVLSGTPGVGDVGATFTVSAQNGVAPDATEVVTITVVSGVAPTFTSAAAPTTAVVGNVYTHTFTATGTPAPTFSSTVLPGWLTLNPTTGLLTGTPTAGDVGTIGPITITAANGIAPDATQVLSIQVGTASGGGGGGGGGDSGGCAANNSNNGLGIFALLGLLSLLAISFRLRSSKA